jgi:hypothetical protein
MSQIAVVILNHVDLDVIGKENNQMIAVLSVVCLFRCP